MKFKVVQPVGYNVITSKKRSAVISVIVEADNKEDAIKEAEGMIEKKMSEISAHDGIVDEYWIDGQMEITEDPEPSEAEKMMRAGYAPLFDIKNYQNNNG